jgi:hypothetical protein
MKSTNISAAKSPNWPAMPGDTVRSAFRDVGHRRHGEFLDRPAHQQISAGAMAMGSADLLVRDRCAVYNGSRGFEFGRRFVLHASAGPAFARACMIAATPGRTLIRWLNQIPDIGNSMIGRDHRPVDPINKMWQVRTFDKNTPNIYNDAHIHLKTQTMFRDTTYIGKNEPENYLMRQSGIYQEYFYRRRVDTQCLQPAATSGVLTSCSASHRENDMAGK